MKKTPIQWIIVVLIIVVVTWLFGCKEDKGSPMIFWQPYPAPTDPIIADSLMIEAVTVEKDTTFVYVKYNPFWRGNDGTYESKRWRYVYARTDTGNVYLRTEGGYLIQVPDTIISSKIEYRYK